MFKEIKYLESLKKSFRDWTKKHYFQLAVFNIFLLSLFLLRSAGYFHPFFVISVNLIVFSALIASIILLNVRNKAMFLLALFFWLFAAFLKVLKIDPWAERTAVYAYQALLIAVLLLFLESINIFRNKKKKNV